MGGSVRSGQEVDLRQRAGAVQPDRSRLFDFEQIATAEVEIVDFLDDLPVLLCAVRVP
ncbi:hypothetical protein ACFX12_035799 [Malus domestica]